MTSKRERIVGLAREKGVLRASDLIVVGIDPANLRHLAQEGVFTRSGRGLYTLSDFDMTEGHALVEATRAQSKGVVCLLSALSFHSLGTQLPFQVWLAIPKGARISKVKPVPTRVVVVHQGAYEAGIETHVLEGVDVQIYGVAKTIADCFKFRNDVGLDVSIEALRDALRDRVCSREDIRKHARINRVEKILRPYLEAFSA